MNNVNVTQATVSEPAIENLIGRTFGPYQLVDALGEGGMATVYKAYQPAIDRHVAIKVLPRHYSKDPEFTVRFQREAKILAQLQHPHILPVFDFGQSDGYSYIVMPFVKRGTLGDLLNNHPQPLSRIRLVITQVGDALNYAHACGLVHRDVKPSNILINDENNCLLTDFGLAKKVEATENLTHTGSVLGTPTYMSPEQCADKPLDGRSDVYALGIILFEMATGHVPFKAETPLTLLAKHLYDPVPPPKSLNPHLSENLQLVILKALTKDPKDRYQTAGELVQALQKALPDGPVLLQKKPALHSGKTAVKLKGADRRAALLPAWAWWGLAGAGAFALAGGLFALVSARQPLQQPPAARPSQPAGTLSQAASPAAAEPQAETPAPKAESPAPQAQAPDAPVIAAALPATPVPEVKPAQAPAQTPADNPPAEKPAQPEQPPQPVATPKPEPAKPAPPPAPAEELPPPAPVTVQNEMALLPAGANSGTDPDFKRYTHTLEAPLWVDAYEVSKKKWDSVYAWAVSNGYRFSNPGKAKGPDHPVTEISWLDGVKWCNARSEMEGLAPCYSIGGNVFKTSETAPTCTFTANGYRLPTANEWRYAARGGLSGKRFPWGDTIGHGQANYAAGAAACEASPTKGFHPSFSKDAEPFTCPVGTFGPNRFGLYDLAGNVAEMIWALDGLNRATQGGSWQDEADYLRIGKDRVLKPYHTSPANGFRTVRSAAAN